MTMEAANAGQVRRVKDFEHRLHEQLSLLDKQGLLRSMTFVQPAERGRILVGGKEHLNLAGNDYLGLGSSSSLLREFYAELASDECLLQYGLGSGASRLMTGSHALHQPLEEELARLHGKDAALLFGSGWHVNTGILPALTRRDDLVLADKLCHASLIDGMRLSAAKVIRYPHLDLDCLERLLRQHSRLGRTVFVVTESIFSMDGDCADLAALAELKERHGAVLCVDEAHAVGVRGPRGLGLAEEQGVLDRIDLLIGTFGKAWAGQGAFVVCCRAVRDVLVNSARSLIFTTALPPVGIRWLCFVLPKIVSMAEERRHLACLAEQLRDELRQQGLVSGGSSQIVPVMIGNAAKAVATAAQLRQQGFWVHAVRPPTVPRDTARLRLSLTAAMWSGQLHDLPAAAAKAMQS